MSNRARYVVGIGASAGGLKAIESFFSRMPADSGAAFVVIHVLGPDRRRALHEQTGMAVHRAKDGMEVEANCVYLMPHHSHLTIANSKLLFAQRESGSRYPIDLFFRSLAVDRGEHAIGVILSGVGSDGVAGVRAIKEAGGMVMVQDVASARFDHLPRAAISTGLADVVRPPEQMPVRLLAYLARSGADSSQHDLEQEMDALESASTSPGGPDLSGDLDDDVRGQIADLEQELRDVQEELWAAIEELESAKQALRASKDELQTVRSEQRLTSERLTFLEALDVGIVTYDADATIGFANRAACRILGLTLAQLKGEEAREPGWQLLRGDRSRLPRAEQPGLVALRTRAPQGPLLLGVTSPSLATTRWIEVKAYPLAEAGGGELTGACVTLRDVSDCPQGCVIMQKS